MSNKIEGSNHVSPLKKEQRQVFKKIVYQNDQILFLNETRILTQFSDIKKSTSRKLFWNFIPYNEKKLDKPAMPKCM